MRKPSLLFHFEKMNVITFKKIRKRTVLSQTDLVLLSFDQIDLSKK